ncbi:MAG: VCBS repeat-containing protein, partial [Planctomycetota bacterium]
MQLRHLGQFSVMLVVLGLGSSAFAQWVDFTNDTGARLNVAASLGASDVEEKDYGIGDFDGDGDEDLAVMRKTPFTSNGPRVNVLLMNEGGVLTDRTADFAVASDVPGDNGFQTPTNDRDVAVVDVNGDGWLDLVTVVTLADGQPKHISHPRVYINLGSSAGCDPTAGNCDPTTWLGFEYQDARFPQLEGTAPGGQPHAPRLCSVAFADIDSDGDMDLYFGDYDSGGAQTLDFNDRMMINDGNGFFTDETTTRFVGNIIVGGGSFPFYQSAFGTSVEFADMDNDGDLDLIKDTALNAPQYVGISSNNGSGTFDSHAVLTTTTPYFVEIGDLNNDGLQDYIISSDGADNYGLNNPANPGGNFTVINFSTLGGDQGFAGNNLIYDLNNDGWNDVLICDVDIDISGCGRRLHIYRNLGNAPNVTLQENADTLPFSPTGVHDIALMDLNDDGWIDMVIGRCAGT